MTATKEQLEYNAYLLEIIRDCGLFKCTDCLYALWEDRGQGMEYKCCGPHAATHCAWNDLETAMRGSACFAFEPSAQAKRNVVERMTKTRDAVNELWKYARDKTEWTPTRETADERRLIGAMYVIEREGMVRI